MKMAPDGTSCTGMPASCSKWDQSVAAVSETISDTATTINWALKLFGNAPVTPSGRQQRQLSGEPGCDGSFGSGSANAIPAALAATAPRVLAHPGGRDERRGIAAGHAHRSRPEVHLADHRRPPGAAPSATQPTMPDEAATILAVETAAAMGFPTFVVGFGTAFNPSDESTLMQMAEVGGTQRYYPVASRDDLSTVLLSLSLLGAGGCVYPITPPPESALRSASAVRSCRRARLTGGTSPTVAPQSLSRLVLRSRRRRRPLEPDPDRLVPLSEPGALQRSRTRPRLGRWSSYPGEGVRTLTGCDLTACLCQSWATQAWSVTIGGIRTLTPNGAQALNLLRMPFRHDRVADVVAERSGIRTRMEARLGLAAYTVSAKRSLLASGIDPDPSAYRRPLAPTSLTRAAPPAGDRDPSHR